jgi:hypothetical protein
MRAAVGRSGWIRANPGTGATIRIRSLRSSWQCYDRAITLERWRCSVTHGGRCEGGRVRDRGGAVCG